MVHTSFVSPDSIPSGILILPIDSKSNTENAFRKAFEQIDANTLTPFYQYKVDEQVSFSIYKGFPNGILEHLLSPLFTQVPSAYFTYYENNLLFCNSINQLESFIYSNILKSTLVNTKEYTSFKQNFAPNDNLFAFCKGGFVPHYGSVLFDGLFGNVITSYSIHYTKLYDTGAKYNILRCLLKRDTTVIRVPWDYDFTTEDYDRITSYNVCYTKLLRKVLPSNTTRRRLSKMLISSTLKTGLHSANTARYCLKT